MSGLREKLLEPRDEWRDQQHDAAAPGPALPRPPNQPRPPGGAAACGGGGGAPLGRLGSAGWLSSLTFSWVAPLLHRGRAQDQLHQGDLFDLPPSLLPATCGRRLWKRWLEVRRGDAAVCTVVRHSIGALCIKSTRRWQLLDSLSISMPLWCMVAGASACCRQQHWAGGGCGALATARHRSFLWAPLLSSGADQGCWGRPQLYWAAAAQPAAAPPCS